jgi:hypothetical protein
MSKQRTCAYAVRRDGHPIQVQHEVLIAMGIDEIAAIDDEAEVDMDGFVHER